MLSFCTLLLFGSLGWFASAAAARPPEFQFEAYTLPNGLGVILHHDASLPRVTVCVAYHVGSKNERAGRTGFAHFFEHMMFRGTANVPNYDIPLQEAGASANAFTSEDLTVYFQTVPSNFLERAIYLEAERLAHLDTALDQEKFDTEREVVKNERRQSFENVPYGLADETIAANLFPQGHPYSWSVIGSMADLNRATLADLRQFFHEFYHPGNVTLCLAGDFDSQQARQWIAKYFGSLAKGRPIGRVAPMAAPPVDRSITMLDRVEAPRVYWSWPTVAAHHEDAAALDMLAAVLASGEASRLYQATVRGRLSTDVDASHDTREIAGQFTIASTAADGKTLDEIRDVLAAELRKIQQAPPSKDEIDRALAQYEKSTYSSLTSPFARALTLTTGTAMYNDPNYYQTEFRRFFQVTPSDVQRVARQYLAPAKLELIVRPVSLDEEESEAALAGPLPQNQPLSTVPPPRLANRDLDWSLMPDPSDERDFVPPTPQRHELSNGLNVWIVPWRTLPIVQCGLLIPVGSADDPPEKEGLATLTASAWSKGVEGLPAVAFAEALDRLGSEMSVVAGTDWTTVSASALQRNLDPTLNLLAKMLTQPLFAEEEFKREKSLLLNDLLQLRASPGAIASRAFRPLLFGSHPYGRLGQGYESSVAGISLNDVRSFHQRMGSQGASMIIVGDVDPTTVVELLERHLGSWRAIAQQEKRPPAQSVNQDKILYLVDHPGAVQSVLYIGQLWKDRQDPSYVPTQIGNRLFGEDFLSRLNQNLRERNGYTYGATSRFVHMRRGGYWMAATSVRADATAPALRELLVEIQGVAGDRPFTDEEISVNQQAEIQSFPERFDGPSAIAGALAQLVQFDLPTNYYHTYAQQLREVQASDVRQAFEELSRSPHRVCLVVGDRASIERELADLDLGEIRVIQPPERFEAPAKN